MLWIKNIYLFFYCMGGHSLKKKLSVAQKPEREKYFIFLPFVDPTFELFVTWEVKTCKASYVQAMFTNNILATLYSYLINSNF